MASDYWYGPPSPPPPISVRWKRYWREVGTFWKQVFCWHTYGEPTHNQLDYCHAFSIFAASGSELDRRRLRRHAEFRYCSKCQNCKAKRWEEWIYK